MPSFIGHSRQIAYFNKLLQKKRLAHAYLFYGPEGLGKFTLAKEIAKILNCDKKPTSLENACGRCPSCRLIEKVQSPEVFILDLERTFVSKKEDRSEIPLEDIRELRRRFSLAGAAGKWQIAIINQADKMSKDAANAFLKLLEEPGEKTLMILIAPGKEAILPTICSRAQSIAFHLLPDRDLACWLDQQHHNKELLKKIIFYAAGRPGVAIDLLRSKEYFEAEHALYKNVITVVQEKNIGGGLFLSEQVSKNKDKQCVVVAHVVKCLRESLLKGGPIFSGEVIKKLKNIDQIAWLLETTNINPRLALDAIFLEAVR